MKQLSLIIFLILQIHQLSGADIIGIWQTKKEQGHQFTYAFTDNGFFGYEKTNNKPGKRLKISREQGKYSIENTLLTIQIDGENKTYRIQFAPDNTLELSNTENKDTQTFKRLTNIKKSKIDKAKSIYDLPLNIYAALDIKHECCGQKNSNFCCGTPNCCEDGICFSLRCPIIKDQLARQIKGK